MLVEKYTPMCNEHNIKLRLISVEGKRNSKIYICDECNKKIYHNY